MKDGTGSSPQPAISLPKGGGAIKGIGETFKPNLFSGTGNFSIPIFTSPGRGGFGPQLTLQYSTGTGNGPFGLGWSLSIPRITRKTEKGLPKYTDEDVFVMSGAEDLVPSDKQLNEDDQPDEYHVTRYRPRTEGLFARIEKWVHKADTGVSHWRATTKENITSIYGKTPQARINDPDNQEHIYEWLLEETFDAKGNHILYEYAKEDKALEQNRIYETNRSYESQRYIRRIFYGNTPSAVSVGPGRQGADHRDTYQFIREPRNRHYLLEVLFDYSVWEENQTPSYTNPPDSGTVEKIKDWAVRDDPFSSFRSGFEIRTLRRCERVLMFHHFTELGVGEPTLVKSTDFGYDNDPQTRLSILSSATITGYRRTGHDDSYTTAGMPPVTFKYSQFTPNEQRYQSVTARGGDMPPVSLQDPQTTLADLHGNALPDVLNTTAAGYYFWQNLGDGQLDMRHPQHAFPAGITLSQPGVAFGDMGGDGMADLIVQWPEMAGFYEATPEGNWKPFKKFDTYPSFGLTDPNVRLLDLTGDGRSDVLMTRDMHFLWFECLGETGYAEPRAVMRNHDPDEFPDVYFNDPSGRVRLADMSGDGLNDIVLLHNGRVDYWPNLGYGQFGRRITMAGSPRLEYNFDPSRLFLADLDGSGCADMVYVDTGKVHFWFNQSGNGWSAEQVISGTPPVTDADSVRFADIYGTGTATLVWSYDYGRYPGENYKALDMCGGKKPYVLSEMSNSMGATTKVQYAPSTKFYLEDKKNSTPWVTNLPFPVHVVAKVEVIDHISRTKLVTTYKYHHGYFDGKEREFRGFGRVDQFDTQTFDDFSSPGLHGDAQLFSNNDPAFHVPPVETRSWFHTGVYFDEDRLGNDGEPFDHHELMEAYKREFYAGDAKAFPMEDQLFKGLDPGKPIESPHEVFRALRGAALRTEVYARDGSEKESHPYVVTQNRYLVTEIQPKVENPHAVYLTTPKESLSYHYERNPDVPRVGHDIILAVDGLGNATDKISIGYPRRNVPEVLPEQGELKILYTKADFINKADELDFYYTGVPYQILAFEVTGYDWDWTRPRFSAGDFGGIMFNTKDPLEEWNFKPYEWKPDGHVGMEKRLVEWTRTYFRNEEELEKIDPPGSTPHRLELGEINRLALPYETYQAVFTSTQELRNQLEDGDDFRIHFADTDDDLELILKEKGGYHQELDITGYWWIPSGRQNYNEDKFLLPEKTHDPFGNKSSIRYDPYGLLMTRAIDPCKNAIRAKNNYRVLQPYMIEDPNRNVSAVRFDELGFLISTATMGKIDQEGNTEGDYLDLSFSEPSSGDKPTTKLEYDLLQQPAYIKTQAREKHKDCGTRWLTSYLYSDGFGREIQTKVQAEPGDANKIDDDGNLITEHTNPRWVGTGRKIYNNKGKPVKQYEPFFSHTSDFENEAALVEWGVTPVLFYDPLERAICTIHPNHTYEKVVFDPWQQETWDVNDTVLLLPREDEHMKGYVGAYINNQENGFKTWYYQRIEDRDNPPRMDSASPDQRAALQTEKHSRTRGTAYLDSLGRPFLTVANNGLDNNGTPQLFETRLRLDIEGNDLEIYDPRNRRFDPISLVEQNPVPAFTHRFDIAGRKIFVNSVDAGRSALLTDIAGNPIRSQDANGNVVRTVFDQLRRPTEIWVRDGIDGNAAPVSEEYLPQYTIYGERLRNEHWEPFDDNGARVPDPAAFTNHAGQILAVYDSAGVQYSRLFDFKGNLAEGIRRLAEDYKKIPNWQPVSGAPFGTIEDLIRANPNDLLQDRVHFTSTIYDALSRVVESNAPDHKRLSPENIKPEGNSIYKYTYNPAGLLETVTVQTREKNDVFKESAYVTGIDYNAKGQREAIFYGNHVQTKYTYDQNTFRLTDLVSKKNNGNGNILQSLHYTYDPVGNITCIRDDAHSTVFNHNTRIEPESVYTYDPTYRLIAATGRENECMTACHYNGKQGLKNSTFVGLPYQPLNDGQAIGKYTEKYEYDPSGNITLIDHHNETFRKHWKRYQDYADTSNRIVSSGAKDQIYNYNYTEIIGEEGACPNETGTIPHDLNGNIEALPHLRIRQNTADPIYKNLKWNFSNELVQADLNQSGEMAYYQYDVSGRRVRKTIVKGSTVEERIYLGGYEIYTKKNGTSETLRRDTHHVMDDKDRIALIEKEVNLSNEVISDPRYRYQLSNHLGSSVMEVDQTDSAKLITYEEYYPYGGTAYIAGIAEVEVSRKRYRYSGKERDDETGLYYYGARYYAPWLGRWVGCDPKQGGDGNNVYVFCGGSPIVYIDPIGHSREIAGDIQAPGITPQAVSDLVATVQKGFSNAVSALASEELTPSQRGTKAAGIIQGDLVSIYGEGVVEVHYSPDQIGSGHVIDVSFKDLGIDFELKLNKSSIRHKQKKVFIENAIQNNRMLVYVDSEGATVLTERTFSKNELKTIRRMTNILARIWTASGRIPSIRLHEHLSKAKKTLGRASNALGLMGDLVGPVLAEVEYRETGLRDPYYGLIPIPFIEPVKLIDEYEHLFTGFYALPSKENADLACTYGVQALIASGDPEYYIEKQNNACEDPIFRNKYGEIVTKDEVVAFYQLCQRRI